MADNATIRLNKVLRELNISLDRAVDFLGSKGHDVDARPTTKISNAVYQVLLDEFQTDMSKKVASKEVEYGNELIVWALAQSSLLGAIGVVPMQISKVVS